MSLQIKSDFDSQKALELMAEILVEEDLIKQKDLSRSFIDSLYQAMESNNSEELFSILSLSSEYLRIVDILICLFQDDDGMKNKISAIVKKSTFNEKIRDQFEMKLKTVQFETPVHLKVSKEHDSSEEIIPNDENSGMKTSIEVFNLKGNELEFIDNVHVRPSHKIKKTMDANKDCPTSNCIENPAKRLKKTTLRVTWAQTLTTVRYIDTEEDFQVNFKHGGYNSLDINEAYGLKTLEDLRWKIPEKINVPPDSYNAESEEIKVQKKRESQVLPKSNLIEHGMTFAPTEHPDLQFDEFETKILSLTDLSHSNKFPDINFNAIAYLREEEEIEIKKILDDPGVIDSLFERNYENEK